MQHLHPLERDHGPHGFGQRVDRHLGVLLRQLRHRRRRRGVGRLLRRQLDDPRREPARPGGVDRPRPDVPVQRRRVRRHHGRRDRRRPMAGGTAPPTAPPAGPSDPAGAPAGLSAAAPAETEAPRLRPRLDVAAVLPTGASAAPARTRCRPSRTPAHPRTGNPARPSTGRPARPGVP